MADGNMTVDGKAGRREWIGLAVLAFPCFLLSMDFTVLHLAVPKLTADLSPSSTQLLWIVDIYGFLIASSLITMGTLGDRIGRRKLLLIGAAAFGAASAVAAFADTASTLIASRGLLGIAGATLMPSTMALIRNMFHDETQRRIAIAMWINAFIVGGAIGPVLGGVMLEHFWWGSVFLLNVPVMALLLVLGPILLPEFRDPNPGRLDIASAALSLSAMLLVIYGIKRIAQDGPGSVQFLAIAAGLAIAVLFVMRQRRLEHPLIDLQLFSLPPFSASVVSQLVATVTFGGLYLLVSQYFQLVVGLSPLRAGMALLPATVVGIVGTFVAPALVKRYPAAYVMPAGMLFTTVGMIALTQLNETSGLTIPVAAYMIMSFGINIAMTLTTDMIMTAAPPERAGSASGISETSAELGAALGVAILGSISTAFYRRSLDDSIPAGLSQDAAANALATIGGAVNTGAQIGGASGAELVQSARSAFAGSLAFVAIVCTLLVAATAISVFLVLRRSHLASGIQPVADLHHEDVIRTGAE
jgi:DHA2 family multidrug resistance protein-like MFS transporter